MYCFSRAPEDEWRVAILVHRHCPMSPFFKMGESSGKGAIWRISDGRHWPSFRIPTKIPPTSVNFAKRASSLRELKENIF